MSTSLHQSCRKTDDISTYIKKQLSTLLKQVKQTPQKKSSSLKKISNIIQKSDMPSWEKKSIQKQIQRVQAAIKRSKSVHDIKLKLKDEPKTKNKYEKMLFYQNLILQQKQLNMKNIMQKQSIKSVRKTPKKQFLNLIQTFEELRTKRLKCEHEIQTISIKAQKLQRLIEIKKQNESKYLQSVQISQKYHSKKQTLQKLRKEIKDAAKQDRKKTISVLMKKYSQVQQS